MTSQRLVRTALACVGALLATVVATPVRGTEAPPCPIERPVVFAGLNWASALIHTEIARAIVEHGYGCTTEVVHGPTLPLLKRLQAGAVDVVMEVWTANVLELWSRLLERGEVVDLGVNFPGATQGWYVPRYVVDGPMAPAPDLRSVFDLAAHADLFREREEEDGQGRLLDCLRGWACQSINRKKLQAYGLAETFEAVQPGTLAALLDEVASRYELNLPFLTYFWEPSWVVHAFELVRLEEPAFEPEIWRRLLEEEEPEQATAYPEIEVRIGATAEFASAAPELAAFLEHYETTPALVTEFLTYMHEHARTPEETARHFLETRERVWTGWVPAAVADRVREALK